jgi:hypothetical protein
LAAIGYINSILGCVFDRSQLYSMGAALAFVDARHPSQSVDNEPWKADL